MSEQIGHMPEGTLFRETDKEPSLDFDAIIVHGKNWRKYPMGQRMKHKLKEILKHEKPLPLKLSKDSRLAALGMGEIWKSFLEAGKKPPVFIFSTGKTRGSKNPSEAEAMINYMRIRYPQIPDSDIVMEDRSYDTVGNIEESKKIIAEHGFQNVGYVTVGYHIPRVHMLMNHYNAPINVIFPSEQWASNRSEHHAKFVDKYKTTPEWRQHERGEKMLIAETIVDPGQRVLSATLAKVIRHQ